MLRCAAAEEGARKRSKHTHGPGGGKDDAVAEYMRKAAADAAEAARHELFTSLPARVRALDALVKVWGVVPPRVHEGGQTRSVPVPACVGPRERAGAP